MNKDEFNFILRYRLSKLKVKGIVTHAKGEDYVELPLSDLLIDDICREISEIVEDVPVSLPIHAVTKGPYLNVQSAGCR